MEILKKLYCGALIVAALSPALALAEPILDKVDVVQTATEADIHIDFQTQIRYVRHFPTKEASRVQVYLEFPEYVSRGLELPTKREFINSPPTDLVPAFTVNFPDQKINSIAIKFKKPVKFRVTPDGSGRGIVIHILLPKGIKFITSEVMAPVAVTAPIDVPSLPDGMPVNDYANKLVAEARVAVSLGEYAKAIEQLSSVLNLPLTTSTQDAQELIGVAREKNGDLAKAKAEYGLYLKQYPDSQGAKRVSKHLADVDAALKNQKISARRTAKKEALDIHETTVYGSWDQYYYDAHSHNYNPKPAVNTHTHDQTSLVSSINLTARIRENQYDGKIVFRNRQTMDFLPDFKTDSNGVDQPTNHTNRDRTDAAYLELQNKDVDYMVRLGRQNGNNGGVLGRFDGIALRYGLTPQYKLNFVAGSLVEYKVDYNRTFYGLNLDIGPIAENWSGNVFMVNQQIKDITDRRAIGGELRYFVNNRSVYSLIDYDVLYDRVNIAMMQGNLQTENGMSYNLLLDHRNSPILTTTNALTGSVIGALTNKPTTIDRALSLGISEADLRRFAIDNTLQTDTALFGATRQFTQRWQLGGDVQVNRTTGTPGASAAAVELFKKQALENGNVLTPQEITNFTNSVSGTGNIWTYHVQAVGTDTFFKDDTLIISYSYTTSNASQSHSVLLSNGMVPSEKWRIDSSLQLMSQYIDPSSRVYTISPTMRASYRLGEKTTVEAEIRFDVANTLDNVNGHTRNFRDAAFIGYRIDI